MKRIKSQRENRAEAAKKTLANRLSSEGWDVWTDFRYRLEDGLEIDLDLLAQKDSEVFVYEFVDPKFVDSKKGNEKKKSLDRLRLIAADKGWNFEVVEGEGSLFDVRSAKKELAALLCQLKEALASVVTAEGQIKAALTMLFLTIADRIVDLSIENASREHGWFSAQHFELARKLIDVGVLTDEDLETIAKLKKSRNQIVHSLEQLRLENAQLNDMAAFVEKLSTKLAGVEEKTLVGAGPL